MWQVNKVLSGVLLMAGVQFSFAATVADIIIQNGNVYTVNASQPWARAVAISGDKILAVGSNAEIKTYQGKNTKVINADGNMVLPGL